ncbi:MAG: ParB/RepB/Spo0J family partition protein [Clostridia bacterium]|nr:ParB/RepB/Spo0J family partition protein [Clostridia bacterium]
MAVKKGGLGRGLDALFADNSVEESSQTPVKLKIMEIEPNREQPRKIFDEAALSELADSIATHGVIQPLLVRPIKDGGYQLVAGERRWRAARIAGLTEVPVVIKDLTDSETVELAMVENLQREDLNPLEEALGYKFMMEKLSITQDEAAQKVGKSRPAVANALRLLKLPDDIQTMVENKQLSPGHARALLSFESEAQMLEVAKLIVAKGLSVREIEKMAQNSKKEIKPKTPKKRDTYFDEVELAISKATGRKVKVKETAKTIEIEFFNNDDLAKIAKALQD